MLVNVDDRTRGAFDSWEAAFEASHPGTDVVLDPVEVGRSALTTAEASHPADRPAVVHVPDTATGVALESGLFQVVAGCGFDPADVVPEARATYTVDGVDWAAPFMVSVPLLYYDKDVFRAAGLDPDVPPTTIDELASTARELVASGATEVGLVLETGSRSGGSWYVEQIAAQLGVPTLEPDNGRTGDRATSVSWNQPGVVDVLTTLQDLVAEEVAVVVSRTEMQAAGGYADLLRLVSADQPAAMAIHTSGSLGPVLDQIPAERVGIAPMPRATLEAATAAPGGAALWLTAGLPDSVALAAREWISYLLSADAQARLAAENGYTPVVAAAMDSPVLIDAVARAPQLLVPLQAVDGRAVDAARLLPVDPSWAELREVLADAVARVLVDGADPASTLAAAEVQGDAILAGAD